MQRSHTISRQVMRDILGNLDGAPFMAHLRGCLPRGTVRQNHSTGDIYWNSADTNKKTGQPFQHLSLHNGGSNHNARGAVHVEYQLPDQGQSLSLRIYIYPVRQPESDDDLWVVYGDYICIDKHPMTVIEDELDWYNCHSILNSVGECLDSYLTPIIEGYNGRAGAPKTRKSKRRNTRKYKPRNTRKSKPHKPKPRKKKL
jgi:hypothetical protein